VPELRYHSLLDCWVILAPEREGRPRDQEDRSLPLPRDCPFCPGNESSTPPEIERLPRPDAQGDGGAWKIRVVPNKYPALVPDIIHKHPSPDGKEGVFGCRDGMGIHEVIIESPDHRAGFPDMEGEHLAEVFRVWADRIRAAYTEHNLAHALVFKNHRARAGASLSHPHSQLIASPLVPKNVKQKMESSRTYFEGNNTCLICEILKREKKSGERIIDDSGGFTMLAPFASRFPYEVFIAPSEHGEDFTRVSDEGFNRLAFGLRKMLRKLKGLLVDPPYNLALITAPNISVLECGPASVPLEDYFHWHIEIMPRLAKVAGFEWGSGFHINTVAPQEAARRLREYPAGENG
jgi:UDPglucose--hexose-1-phosphate uridylyltransferase